MSRGEYPLADQPSGTLRRETERELAESGRWGTTLTLIQSWGRLL